MRSGIAGFAANADQHFYLPENYTDAFNNRHQPAYGPFDLFVQSTQDALGNTASVEQFDYRVLAPSEMKDPNGNYQRGRVRHTRPAGRLRRHGQEHGRNPATI